mmetsp:Transcript_49960/g.149222  ORF Transcript_49960/g.149222 Transcript_49960/m.149222 type:complete len:232 (-) Transcript_49960:92-787(-)
MGSAGCSLRCVHRRGGAQERGWSPLLRGLRGWCAPPVRSGPRPVGGGRLRARAPRARAGEGLGRPSDGGRRGPRERQHRGLPGGQRAARLAQANLAGHHAGQTCGGLFGDVCGGGVVRRVHPGAGARGECPGDAPRGGRPRRRVARVCLPCHRSPRRRVRLSARGSRGPFPSRPSSCWSSLHSAVSPLPGVDDQGVAAHPHSSRSILPRLASQLFEPSRGSAPLRSEGLFC